MWHLELDAGLQEQVTCLGVELVSLFHDVDQRERQRLLGVEEVSVPLLLRHLGLGFGVCQEPLHCHFDTRCSDV
jgi:hypothetical protein